MPGAQVVASKLHVEFKGRNQGTSLPSNKTSLFVVKPKHL